ncbi:MAG: FixH family protein [Herminiimonas sp.]|uniref:FixH family protein n=1 Tax=Herminiimonas sp. TaxID=1926289 RepID=UPI002727F725|nr:FixH family protein [Herminiimonas sp.]MDO9420920.1 FixH family protein [Herminiimonas sp.]
MSKTTAIFNQNHDEGPWYKHRWPWLLMLGPFAVVIAGSITMWIAVTQQDALVVDDYYKQGKAINQDLRRDRVATDLGVQFSAHYDTPTRILSGSISNKAKQAIGDISVRLIHATIPEKDIVLLIQPDKAGHFSVALPMLDLGRWQVLVENEKRDWRLNGIWTWPAQRSFAIEADEQ